MKAVKCLVILMALAYCVEGRQRLGKVFKRQARHREDKAIQGPQAGLVHQTVVRQTFAQPESQVSDGKTQGSEINVPLIPQQQFRQAPYQQAQQQVAPPPYAPQPIAPNPYQPNTQQVAQPSYVAQPIPQNQYAPSNQQVVQPSYPAQPIAPIQYQPITSNQVQQGQQAPYSEISLAEALQSPLYGQALVGAYQTTPNYAQPIAMRDVTNKILMRLPSNATIIRPNIIDGFSCAGKPYGYYADISNECQIFHICFPLKSVFNNQPEVPDVTYEYSFICNEFTRFSQDSLTCAWRYEAVPCKDSELLYSINDHFFKITTPAPPINYRPVPGPIAGSVPLGGGYPSGPFP